VMDLENTPMEELLALQAQIEAEIQFREVA
jgi:hypothetical protein